MNTSFEKKLDCVVSSSQEENNESLAVQRNRMKILSDECQKLNEKFKEHKINLNIVQQKREAILQHFEVIAMKSEEFFDVNLPAKLSQTVKVHINDDLNEKFHNFCSLLGYKLTNYDYQEDASVKLRLYYNNSCYIDLESNDNGNYKISSIEPTPQNYEAIEQFLEKTQDVQGLLINLRKYFSQLKQQEED